MKRIDRFRAMSAEELAEMLGYKACRWCSYYNEPNDKCSINIVTRNPNHCKVGITEGLNQEDNPMPEIKVGDMFIYMQSQIPFYGACVYDNIVYLPGEDRCHNFGGEIKEKIIAIKRYNIAKGTMETIWRADNEKDR